MIWMAAYLAAGLITLLLLLVRRELQSSRPGEPVLRLSSGNIRDDLLTVPVFVGMVVAWPLFLRWAFDDVWGPKVHIHKDKPFAVERENLGQHMMIPEIESRERVIDLLGAVPEGPFGHFNAAWLTFKSTLAPGDMLWSFKATCNRGSWYESRSGYAIVRNDAIHSWFVAAKAFTCADEKEEKAVELGDIINHGTEQLPAARFPD